MNDPQMRLCRCVDPETLRTMLVDDLRRRLIGVNEREAEAWAEVTTRAGWEAFRDRRIDALQASLGDWPPEELPLQAEVTGRLQGEGFAVEKTLYVTRPGIVVTANLYLPDPPSGTPMPAVVICHSHHNPKTQKELQDMGAIWARSGAAVLVMDQLGHGERRQQPFGGREDYRWRYVEGMQLDLLGESLIGWMAWDMIRGIDLLIARGDVDAERIILLGAVAGGGDPTAVLAALSEKATCAIPFNFGEPESADTGPNWACSGSWESTRNLRGSAQGGFFPWVIDAAAAPRPFILGCEFDSSRGKQLVWERLARVWGLYDSVDRLAEVHGWGEVTKRPPDASHCNNVGPMHREQIYPLLEKWLDMADPRPEREQRFEPEQLDCLTDDARRRLGAKLLHEVLADSAGDRLAAARARRAGLGRDELRRTLREELTGTLGKVAPESPAVERQRDAIEIGGAPAEAITLAVEPGIFVPMLLLRPAGESSGLVVAVSQAGAGRTAEARKGGARTLLDRGLTVCLPDLRGCGETSPTDDRDWHAEWNALGTWVSSTELMLGQTLLGSRLRDLLSAIDYLVGRDDIPTDRLAIWGDSPADVNPPGVQPQPMATETPLATAEPMGALVALLAGLFDDRVSAAAAHGGIVGYASLLDHWACCVPHDVIVPGILRVADVADIVAALAPTPVRLTGLVDGLNRLAMPEQIAETLGSGAPSSADAADGSLADWLTEAMHT